MMKPLLLLILLSLVSLSHHLSAAASPQSPVRDTKGEVLKVGSNYFVLPVIRGRGGGLYPANIKSNATICPLDVIQEADEVQKGIPVVLTPFDNATSGGVVRLSTDLNVRFFTPTICARKTVWKLDGYDKSVNRFFVKTGGVEGNPGPDTLSSWFKIEKYKDVYKFVYCPTVCNYCKVLCKDVGIFEQDGVRFLALSDVPFKVIFEKTF